MSTRQQVDAILRQDFNSFIHKAFRTVVPGVRFMPNWHIEAIAWWLQGIREGDINRLIITMPPRHLKSIAASVAFPAWLLGHDPTQRIVCVSYSQDLADTHAHHMRVLMQSDWYRRVFPGTRFQPNKQPLSDLTTTRGGYRLSTSVGGTLTGRGGNVIIIDDPHKASEVESEVQRQAVLKWYRNTVPSRLDDPGGGIILIQQRLHENDLAGYLLETDEWTHLNLPALAEEDEEIEIGKDQWYWRRKGSLLHPERIPLEALESRRRELGSHHFEAQYQQRPAPLGGGMVKWDWFRFYDRLPTRHSGDQLVQSWDPAQSLRENSDWSVCTTWLVQDNRYYLLDVERFRAEAPELLHRITKSARESEANLVLIEAVGHGIGLFQQTRRQVGIIVRAVHPKGDKVARMSAESPAIEAGYVYLPREAPWLPELQRELVHFPHGKHDDQVDSISQFLYWARHCGPDRPKLACRITPIGPGPDLDYHFQELW